MTHQDQPTAPDDDGPDLAALPDDVMPHAFEMPPVHPAPSEEALAAVHESGQALARASQYEARAARIVKREREMNLSNHFVLAFKRALGVPA